MREADRALHLERMARLAELAEIVLDRYDVPSGSRVEMVNHSENTTYRVDTPEGEARWALRVHREAYHSQRAIESELAWMQALRTEAGVHTPRPVPGRDGSLIQTVHGPGLPRPRHCVLFEWLEGHEPEEDELLVAMERLGELSGRMHRHSRQWQRPSWFERLSWDYDTMLGDRPHWGRWRDGFALTPERLALLERLSATIRHRLESFGKGPDRYGLVHADIRLANLLVHQNDTRVIDFDDCGFSWCLYDCATALSFIEDRPDLPQLIDAWVRGYRQVLPLSREEEAEIPTFVMLRRLLLVAWIGSHAETDLAQQMGDNFTAGTCVLAESYLSGFG